ncbi:hypothetical protein GGI07_004786 [Coemansia sp. Benny D115]|nr:hypothetical protein GGI07_004786 [Coemansia sp. Benny D115]
MQRGGLWLVTEPRLFLRRSLANLSAGEIRKRYTEYFVKNGHQQLDSSDIVPKNDPTLLFTSAGMVPFKQFFIKPETAPYRMVTTVQKCVRAGGKHNDLDQVGYTPRHHTFFEMLGNFSFGAYDKRAIIHMAWGFVTKELELPTERLRVTVLEDDDEAYAIWRDEVGLDPGRIVRCGPEDNFWSMGNGEGPCGPSSEIFWDTQDARYSESDDERWLEFWNLVFMQYHRGPDGELRPLKVPCIDTGMGLERVASILQGKTNNFDTNEFQTIVDGIAARSPPAAAVASETGEPDKAMAMTYRRIIADHLRASVFLISEGVYPSNTGRGYVLRRIIRRALRAGRLLGLKGGVLSELYPSLEQAMGAAYPEIVERREPIVSVLRSEEGVFLKALDKGVELLENIFANQQGAKVVSGADAFALYDTHGFPVDLTQIIAREHGWSVDTHTFDEIQRESRERNRASWKGGSAQKSALAGEIQAACLEWQSGAVQSRFCGYEIDPEARQAPVRSKVAAFRELPNGDALVIIDPCPFYAAGGGQQADAGTVSVSRDGATSTFAVKNATALANGLATVLHLEAAAESQALLDAGQEVEASIDVGRRLGTTVHHTATHLLNAALRKVVGNSVMQAGSLVQRDGLRFDFTSGPLTQTQLDEVEQLVNQAALSSPETVVRHMSLEQAKKLGAIAMFTEKYNAESVRVVEIPRVSMELCGGTHLRSAHAVFPFHIVSEGSIGAGTRRIEAVAGMAGSLWLQKQLQQARATAHTLDVVGLGELNKRAQQVVEKTKQLREEANAWLRTAAAGIAAAFTHTTTLGDARVPVVVHVLPLPSAADAQRGASSARLVAERACYLRDTQPSVAHVVIQGEAVALGVSERCVPAANAGALLRNLFTKLPGKGGGQSTLAQGRLKKAVSELDHVSFV